jgi:sortase A
VYEVENIKIGLPEQVDVLGPASKEQLTLITCTPIGTNLKRLIVTARLVEKS